MVNIGAETAKLAGLQIDLLSRVRKGSISLAQLEQYITLTPAKRANLDIFFEHRCPKLTPTNTLDPTLSGPDLARLILGDNFISQDEMSTDFGWTYTEEQKALYEENFPTLEELLWLRLNNYLLVVGPPQNTNLLGVRDFDPELFYTKSGGWYAQERHKFNQEDIVGGGEWQMVRKVDVPKSRSKTWREQEALLTSLENVPNAAEVAYVVAAFKKVRGINLLPNFWVRTSSVTAGGDHVYVGGRSGGGLDVSSWGGSRNDSVGGASARKAP